ncbi:MAG TPA: hypothetical protein VNJ70_12730 [Thermoanaerobaculia bacterium]|nr:hypothetical protein [Thermoanaerobaculia bacterium]
MSGGGDVAELERLSAEARRSLEAGRLDEAEAQFERLVAAARGQDDERSADRAYCYLAAIGIELGRGEQYVSELRQILMRSADDESCYRAAYNIARAYELKKENKKAAFYARIAHDRAEQVGRREWLASAKNLRANLLVTDSFFAEARGVYEEALHLAPELSPVWRALIQDNLGYCYAVEERYADSFRLLYRSLRSLRRHGAKRYEVFPLLSLCYAHLEVGRLRSAVKFGLAALQGGEAVGDVQTIKYALFLLGEAANLAGDHLLARRYFARLQEEHYPDAAYLPDFLLAIDVRKMINLRA